MPLFAVVPVQRLDTAKSRLSSVLSVVERGRLVVELLHNVLAALQGSAAIDGIIVVSPDPHVLALAEASGAITVEQNGRGLNAAIRLGRDRACELGADALLVVLADLPFLTSHDVDQFVELSRASTVTLAPDRHGHGTNAMILRPPMAIEPAFGVDSFHKHAGEAERLGLSRGIFQSHGTGFDVDGIDDLNDLGWLDNASNRDFVILNGAQRRGPACG
jgi:2-phospho-L-lactate guanylyltransferase